MQKQDLKRIINLFVLSLLFTIGTTAQTKLRADNIDQVVSELTLEEKCHLVLGVGMGFGKNVKFPGTAGGTLAIPHLGIPAIYCADSNQGLRMSVNRDFDSKNYWCTDFMTSMTLASTWDREAAYAIGKAIGNETREYGLDWILAPSMNLVRNPLCGRNHEYYSEDPYLSGTIAAGYVKGVQSEGTAACIKHFVANNQETNRNANDSRMSQRALRELYLRGFEIAVKGAKPWTIMTAYNNLNGIATCENPELTETILRDEWGFDGLVVSDWNAGTNAAQSMLAGNDMMQPGQDRQYQAIYDAVKSGKLPEDVLNRSVKRVLQLVVRCPGFKGNNYSNEPNLKAHAQTDRKIGAEGMVLLKNNGALPITGKNVALYGCTSYDIIPGGTGFGGTMNGYYCVSLVEGLRNAGYTVDKNLTHKFKAHIDAENKRLYPNGLPPFSLRPLLRAEEPELDADDLKSNTKQNDIAIITIGRKSGEAADRTFDEFNLYEKELQTIRQVSEAYHAQGKKVVVLLNVCSPVETASWKDMVDGILCTWQSGEQVGNSMADVLSGKVNPSGKLPVTFAADYNDDPSAKNFPGDVKDTKDLASMYMWGGDKNNAAKKREPVKNIDYTDYEEDIYVGYRYFTSFGKAVSFPFGYGLSYTTFDYKNAKITGDGHHFTITVDVINTGKTAGRNVVELFVAAPNSKKANKPVRELRNYAKTKLLAPGQAETITMEVSKADLASFDEKASAWKTDAGTYEFQICSSANDVEAVVTGKVKAWKAAAHNAVKPQVKLNLLKR